MSAARAPVAILLLEDSDIDVELLQAALDRAGLAYDLTRVWQRKDFIAAMMERPFDLILADYVLPDFYGQAALEIAQKTVPNTPFIFVSGTLGEHVAIESLKNGATDFVLKHGLDRLPAAITRALSEARERLARQSAEQKLIDINASLEATVATRTAERDLVWRVSQDLFLICGPDARVLASNPAWHTQLGYTTEQVFTTNLDVLIHADDLPRAIEAMREVTAGKPVFNIDLKMFAADGTHRCFSWTLVPTQGGQFYAAGRDVSARMDLEARLRHVQKMESIGHLTGGVAHDFNNLLTIILGNLETLQRSLPLDTEPRHINALDNAVRGAERAAKLTGSLLAFSRRQPLDPEAINVSDLVLDLSDLLGRTLGEHVYVHTELATDIWSTYIDPNQLENTLINLAVNARDAMIDGGRLTITTENRTFDEFSAESQGGTVGDEDLTPGQYVILSVTDTGVGMDTQVIASAFDPFFTTKGAGQGTGLGLSQVYGFVKQSGGHVNIRSAVDVGTTIELLLPRDLTPETRVRRSAPRHSESIPTSQSNETILVVEDDDDVRAHSCNVLGELGYEVIAAEDGPMALTKLAAHPEIALMFTDVGLPNGMNGRQLAERAQGMRPDLPVLYTSAYAASALVTDGRLDAGVHLISKPFPVHVLAQRLREMLAPPKREQRILLVDDDEMVRMLAAELLLTEGYIVDEAASIAQALESAKGERLADIGIAIVDLGLPDGRGDALARILLDRHEDLQVIIVSGQVDAGVREQFAGDDRMQFISKPYRSATLLQMVSQALG